MTVVSRAQVGLFLFEAKKLIAKEKWSFVERRKNLDALAVLGWNKELLEEMLYSLTPGNYVSGPDKDRELPDDGEVWVFGATIEDSEYYIKLKLRTGRELLCLSFHEAKYPLERVYGR